jgi:hypothetical protein
VKAIYIDSVNQTVEPVEVDGSLDNYYRLIRTPTRIMEAVYPRVLAAGDVLYVDEEGLFNGHENVFRIGSYPQSLFGSGVIVGTTEDGDSADATTPIATVRDAVTFRRLGRRVAGPA